MAEPPPLKRHRAGSSPAGCTWILGSESEEAMTRLISLFKEPQEYAARSEDDPPQPAFDQKPDGEPEYFKQLLEYLRERNEKERSSGNAD